MLTTARQKMRDAASDTADIVHGLTQLGLTKFLPSSSLTVVTPAAVVHLTNLQSTNPHVRDESAWNFRQCIDVLNDLKDIYPGADYETACLQRAAEAQYGQIMDSNPVLIMLNDTLNMNNTQSRRTDNRIITEPGHYGDDELGQASNPAFPSPSSLSERAQRSPSFNQHIMEDWNQDIYKEWIVSSDDGHNSRIEKPSAKTTEYLNNGFGRAPDRYSNTGPTSPHTGTLPELQLPAPPFPVNIITGDLEKDLGFV